MKVHCASNNEKGGHTHDAQSKLSKNQKKICFRIAVIQTLFISFSSNEYHFVASFI